MYKLRNTNTDLKKKQPTASQAEKTFMISQVQYRRSEAMTYPDILYHISHGSTSLIERFATSYKYPFTTTSDFPNVPNIAFTLRIWVRTFSCVSQVRSLFLFASAKSLSGLSHVQIIESTGRGEGFPWARS
jgi:hypothetical protein